MKRALNNVQKLWFLPYHWRRAILRRMGAKVGPFVMIEPDVHFSAGPLSIGHSSYINVGCYIDCSGGVTIGTRCYLAQQAHLVTGSHEMGPREQRAGAVRRLPIVIGDGCWIAAEAMVLPGRTVAPGCVIGARALVTKDTEPNGVYVGSPAYRLRDADASDPGFRDMAA